MKSVRTSWPMWLITFVTLLGFTSLWLHYDKSFDVAMYGVIIMALCWTAYFILSSMSVDDQYILLIVLMLFSIGTIMIFRCDKPSGEKQVIWFAVGLVAFFISYLVVMRTKFISKIGFGFFIAAVAISLLTIVIGTSADGTSVKNWIIIGPVSIQTTEIVKYLVLFILADRYYTPKRYRIFGMHEGVTVSAFVYVLLAIMAVQGELGTILVVFTTYIAMMYLFNEERWIIWGTVALIVLGALALWLLQDAPLIEKVWDKLAGRFEVWGNLWDNDATAIGIGEMRQSMYAIGSGGFFGAGVGLGSPDTISTIGAEKSDYIFASISEEMGIMIGVAIILMFFLLMYRGLRLSLNIKHKFYRTIGAGICIMFGFQTFIIIGGVTNLIPLTGITLPFVSYGGSSLVIGFLAIGFLEGAANKTDDTLKAMVKKSGGIKGADFMGDERYSHSVLRKGDDEWNAAYTTGGKSENVFTTGGGREIWAEQDLSYQEDYEKQRSADTIFFSAGDLSAKAFESKEKKEMPATTFENKYADGILFKKPVSEKNEENKSDFFSGGGNL